MFISILIGKDLKKRERYAVSETKNGRLAMLAISGKNGNITYFSIYGRVY